MPKHVSHNFNVPVQSTTLKTFSDGLGEVFGKEVIYTAHNPKDYHITISESSYFVKNANGEVEKNPRALILDQTGIDRIVADHKDIDLFFKDTLKTHPFTGNLPVKGVSITDNGFIIVSLDHTSVDTIAKCAEAFWLERSVFDPDKKGRIHVYPKQFYRNIDGDGKKLDTHVTLGQIKPKISETEKGSPDNIAYVAKLESCRKKLAEAFIDKKGTLEAVSVDSTNAQHVTTYKTELERKDVVTTKRKEGNADDWVVTKESITPERTVLGVKLAIDAFCNANNLPVPINVSAGYTNDYVVQFDKPNVKKDFSRIFMNQYPQKKDNIIIEKNKGAFCKFAKETSNTSLEMMITEQAVALLASKPTVEATAEEKTKVEETKPATESATASTVPQTAATVPQTAATVPQTAATVSQANKRFATTTATSQPPAVVQQQSQTQVKPVAPTSQTTPVQTQTTTTVPSKPVLKSKRFTNK